MVNISSEKRIKHLEIILKISERCNINCDYCYVYNKGNTIADNSPARISNKNILQLVGFLQRACREYSIGTLQIDLHGGEPLLMKKENFASMCELLMMADYCGSNINLALQTNGTLVDDEWISLFEKYSIHVSISIDGPKHINDRHRLDTKGRSTYEGTVRGLRRLQHAHQQGRLRAAPGILCVANPQASGTEIYRHFVDDLGVYGFDLLIPDDAYSDDHVDPISMGRFLNEALDEWVKDDNPKIFVRLFQTHIATLLGAKVGVLGHTPEVTGAYACTVGSDGFIRVDDTLRATSDRIFDPIGHVSDISLSEVLDSPQFQEYTLIGQSLPTECENCIWAKVCAGGRIMNRFSPEDRFNRKSVYCYSMRSFLSRASAHLLNMGIKEERIMAAISQ
ncbi:cyclophane-forming radical SAM/SPASM peptide maturase XyeB [Yersinia aleksiciae]|uniref:Galns arylsulfatase regulator (Fe-S oxidoreductase) n=1 Tax=Yersinia aleksiciae TaxID=263819 RepID=A0A0T9U1I2_YERAE|nr:cyclophane-forming radical SAM/SPASM peptide maturase XyeB [Yersinia aleksiciae]AKP35151.1 radical SAM protein [Yersinia aleksiciae]MDA5496707.1 XyeB family radical SAM/SPASM peptide maturase [Yersinia aleksiciae]NIK97536.1 XyeB family radical SAM/SPASM peptide maturase [Yersinia aleksiciae]WQC69307.1 cyclophane-forming radical SAM/SPASM peptide maturase XyeB [Yersinia aleksiciae]CFQ39380.1 galns arylsulfatase regulator (Fe-S oxidoreductase) [Yersinia aleksiciae]